MSKWQLLLHSTGGTFTHRPEMGSVRQQMRKASSPGSEEATCERDQGDCRVRAAPIWLELQEKGSSSGAPSCHTPCLLPSVSTAAQARVPQTWGLLGQVSRPGLSCLLPCIFYRWVEGRDGRVTQRGPCPPKPFLWPLFCSWPATGPESGGLRFARVRLPA